MRFAMRSQELLKTFISDYLQENQMKKVLKELRQKEIFFQKLDSVRFQILK